MKIGRKSLAKISLILVLIFFFLFYINKIPVVITQDDPINQFNQSQSINITGIASTVDQATINNYLNTNGDGSTWDVTEADVTPPPAWSLTFTTQQVESLSVTPLNSDKFVVAWCDEASKAINFKIYSTNGQVLVDTVTVDSSPGITNACDYNSVSVAALNSTHFAIAWFDAAEADATFAVYDSTGTLRLGPIDEDTDVGASSFGVSISAFNSTHIVIGYYDYTDQDATFSTWNLVTQTRVIGPVDVDTGVSTDCYNVHVAALNSTHFVFFYYDAGATDDATFAIYKIDSTTAVKAATDEDAAIVNYYSLSLTVLNSSYFVLAYYDAADQDITFSIYNSAGTRVVGPIDEDTAVGASGAWVSVAALNSTHFVIAYYDAADGQHTFSIYNWNTRVVGPIDISSTTLKWVSVASYLAAVNIGICNQNWIFAEAYSTSNSRFFAYNPSGTQWNGYCAPIYQVSVEHNATISYSGILNSINVSINFTSTVDDTYNMTIYNFANSNWDASPCQNISVTANIYYTIWCNITNPAGYVSSENKVRVRLNSTAENDQATLKEEYVQFYVSYTVGYLEVELVQPDTTLISNVVQNSTFLVNATVFCRAGPCGYVNGTLMYNLTSPYPDTLINTSFGDKPFFVNETPALAMKACPNNPLNEGDFCNLTWIINATGEINTGWKIGVYFNSSYPEVQPNTTLNATVSITSCTEEISLAWSSIDFSLLTPSTNYNPAPYNDQNFYNITNKGSCPLQLWIKGTDLQNSTLGSTIAVGNLSWSNYSSSYTDFHRNITYDYVLLNSGLSPNQNLTTYYWLSVPAVYAGYYLGSVYICGNYSSIC
jgi:hypothetical protein